MVRSRTGCLTCRQRKLKCGEQKPKCAQCTKAGRECSYGEGIVFRHQQNASMNGEGPSSAGGGLDSFYSYKNTFGPNSVWVDIPQQVTFVNIQNPFDEDLDRLPENDLENPRLDWHNIDPAYRSVTGEIAAHGLEALSAAATRGSTGYHFVPMPGPQATDGDLSATYHSNPNIPFLLNHADRSSPPIDPTLQALPANHGVSSKIEQLEQAVDISEQVFSSTTKSNSKPQARSDEDVAVMLSHIQRFTRPSPA